MPERYPATPEQQKELALQMERLQSASHSVADQVTEVRRIAMAGIISVIGLDTAKHVFRVHGADASGRAVLRKRLRRNQVSDFFANVPRCLVGLEATRGAHYWVRILSSFGHEVKLIAPQFVNSYLAPYPNLPTSRSD